MYQKKKLLELLLKDLQNIKVTHTIQNQNMSNYAKIPYENYLEEAEGSYTTIRESLIYAGNTLPPIMARNLKDFSSEAEYIMIAYNRSQLAFEEVRKNLGEDKFYKLFKGFFNDYAYKNVTL